MPPRDAAELRGSAGRHATRLLAIGRQLDAKQLHSVTIVEIDDGYVIRASHHTHRQPVLIEAPHAEFTPDTAVPPTARQSGEGRTNRSLLCGGGYSTVLHALGRRLDQQQATAIAISEGQHFVAVSLHTADGAVAEELYLADDLARLIARG